MVAISLAVGPARASLSVIAPPKTFNSPKLERVIAVESDVTMDRAFAAGPNASQSVDCVYATEANAGLLLGSGLLIALLGRRLLRRK